jgi:biopolymer transport protein ExbD
MKNRIAQSFGALTKSGGKTGEKKTLDLLPFSTVSFVILTCFLVSV